MITISMSYFELGFICLTILVTMGYTIWSIADKLIYKIYELKEIEKEEEE